MTSSLSRRSLLAAAALAAAAHRAPARADGARVPADASLDTLFRARDWVNGTPGRDALRGKVVLVDVFTFDCINCKNITPNLRTLARTRRDGLVIVGVHSPETSYERDRAQVVRHLAQLGVTWPVAIDNDFALWKAYGIDYWPTQLLFDRRGKLRTVVEGDSQDARVDAAVDALLRERAPVVDARLVVPKRIARAGTVWATIALVAQPGFHLREPTVTWRLPSGITAGAPVSAGPAGLRIPLAVAPDAAPAARAVLQAEVRWAACAHVCVTGRTALEAVVAIA
jgi:hypothetical protein